jgi:hypothetical protein
MRGEEGEDRNGLVAGGEREERRPGQHAEPDEDCAEGAPVGEDLGRGSGAVRFFSRLRLVASRRRNMMAAAVRLAQPVARLSLMNVACRGQERAWRREHCRSHGWAVRACAEQYAL